jgi:TPP-dependent pyruvate/acetoin dehydrogenase alpha subunit
VTVSLSECAHLYEEMVRIRMFEDEIARLFLEGEIPGTTHLYQGQEAVAVGVCAALEPGDSVAATYRGHGACLARHTDPTALFAELLGRATGVCGGRAGSMNIVDLVHGVIGCFGIVGGSIGAATGAALAAQLLHDGSVSVAFFGDGATNQGYFHESLNFAAVRRMPVVFVCENNRYGEWTATEKVTAGNDIAARADAYGMPGVRVDGNDVLAVRDVARSAVTRARAGDGPTLLECETYRHKGHSRSDPGRYRPREEVTEWLARDPLSRLDDVLAEADRQEIDGRVRADLEAALSVALAAPAPEPSAMAALQEVAA